MKSRLDDTGGSTATASQQPDVRFHPLLEVIPELPQAELNLMAEDLRRVGRCAPFLVVNSVHKPPLLIDDRNRFQACIQAKLPVQLEPWDGFGSLAITIARNNVPRAHLTDSQRAAIAVPIALQISAERKAQRERGLRRGQENAKTAFSENPPVSVNLRSRGNGAADGDTEYVKSAELAAEPCHVSPSSVEKATRIFHTDSDLYKQLLAGEVNLNQANLRAYKKEQIELLKETAKAIPPRAWAGAQKAIVIGDCLEKMAELKSGSFDLIFADPPYNNGTHYDADPTRDRLSEREYLNWCKQWMHECARLLTPTGSFFVLIDDNYSDYFGSILRTLTEPKLHRRNTIVWWESFPQHTDGNFVSAARYIHYFTRNPNKYTWNADAIRVPSKRETEYNDQRRSPKGRIPDNVWAYNRQTGSEADTIPFTDHPPQIPEDLLTRIILAASNVGDDVLDPFAGNGTTLRTALKLGRTALGIERSPKYADQARQWIASALTRGGGGTEPAPAASQRGGKL